LFLLYIPQRLLERLPTVARKNCCFHTLFKKETSFQ